MIVCKVYAYMIIACNTMTLCVYIYCTLHSCDSDKVEAVDIYDKYDKIVQVFLATLSNLKISITIYSKIKGLGSRVSAQVSAQVSGLRSRVLILGCIHENI